MNKFKIAIVAAFAVLGIAVLTPAVSYADPAGDIQTGVDAVGGDGAPSLQTSLKTIVNILLYVLGAIAVIMIVIGGIRYATSNGDSASIKAAKDTILYSVIGLIVAMMAFAIVNFVVGAF